MRTMIVQRSVRRELLHVKGFEGRALGNPTFHLLPFTVFEIEAGGFFSILPVLTVPSTTRIGYPFNWTHRGTYR
jgi:hypothetical protein